jgi:hypothetical protein
MWVEASMASVTERDKILVVCETTLPEWSDVVNMELNIYVIVRRAAADCAPAPISVQNRHPMFGRGRPPERYGRNRADGLKSQSATLGNGVRLYHVFEVSLRQRSLNQTITAQSKIKCERFLVVHHDVGFANLLPMAG